jgi:AmmeMemoRadiSam system protein A
MAAKSRGVVFGGLSPHPPLIIPEVGGPELRRVSKTVNAVRRLASELVASAPETVVIVGPHGPVSRRAFIALSSPRLQGDFGSFGAPQASLSFQNDIRLLKTLVETASAEGIEVSPYSSRLAAREPWEAAGELDYATMVPLYYLREEGYNGRVLVLSMAYTDYRTCLRFGEIIARAADQSGKPVALLASGDLSHRLKPGAPAGYDPLGRSFDDFLIKAVGAGDAERLAAIDPDLVEHAGECGLRPVLIMLGGVLAAGLVPEVLSYEGPFGVGYGVVVFRSPAGAAGGSEESGRSAQAGAADAATGAVAPAGHQASDRPGGSASKAAGPDPLVSLARQAVEAFVRGRNVISPPAAGLQGSPPQAGAFVSLHLNGELRGCIGTIEPTRDTLGEEIVRNAIAAATEDPRFPRVTPGELRGLDISVDVLGAPEPIPGPEDLDPRKYGVIVEKGYRRGLLLPDLEGVDTAKDQVAIACRKAGLRPDTPGISLYRFEVVRHH